MDYRPAALVAAGAAVTGMAWAVRGRSSQVFGPSVWHGSPDRKSVALTFDDGPSPATNTLLEILRSYGARATFFQCGSNVERAPEISRSVLQAGHEIGNHSHTHPNFALKSASFIEDEFARAQDIIADATSHKPTLMRAPYGVRWQGFARMQSRLRLRGVMWTVIGRDWKLSADGITKRVLGGVRNGAIICLHDGRATLKDPDVSQTVEAVRRIVPALLREGYHFETVPEIICPMRPPVPT